MLIQSGLVNIASHQTSVQSSDLIMTLAHHYVLEEKAVKSVTREIVLGLKPQNIEKVFHLPKVDQYLQITYDSANIWYKENEIEARKLV